MHKEWPLFLEARTERGESGRVVESYRRELHDRLPLKRFQNVPHAESNQN